jgi:outer membrane protein assembly factor BamD
VLLKKNFVILKQLITYLYKYNKYMTLSKILLACFCALMLAACATNPSDSKSFKNYSAKQLLESGEKSMTKRNYRDAIKYFEAIDSLYPFDHEARQGQLDIIYTYYKTDDYASALAAADRYIHLYPTGKHTDYAHYMKGVINFEKDRTWLQRLHARQEETLDLSALEDSFINFETLIKLFPKSVYAKDAEKRMLHIRDLLAKSELKVAKFYFKRKAYIAAANRARYIVKHLAGTPQVVDALKIMIKSYRALDADKQANDALRILNLNFPKERV